MSLLSFVRRRPLVDAWCLARRSYASQSKPLEANAVKTASPSGRPGPAGKAEPKPLSSCPEGTVLEGVNYLKNQPPVVALADDAYPPWLWKLLEPKVIPDDGPGGIGEKIKLRRENRQRIRDQNFMKTQ